MTRPQSIQNFILEERAREQGSNNDSVIKLYDEWMTGMDRSVADFRAELDPWFMKCYSVICKNIQIETDVRGEIEDVLKDDFDKAVNDSSLGVKARSVLQEVSFSDFLEQVVKCVEREQDLITRYKKERDEQVKRLEADAFDQRISAAQQLCKNLQHVLDACSKKLNESHLNDTNKVNVWQIGVQHICKQLEELSSELKTKLRSWLKSFQLKYAELAAPHDFDGTLKELSRWCGQVGKLLYDTLTMITDGELNSIKTRLFGEEGCNRLGELFYDFLNSTFIVTKQTSFCVKTLKKTFPEFEISLLAAAYIPRNESVTAEVMIVSEDDIKDATIDDKQCWENKSLKLSSNTKTMNLNASPLVFTFDKLQFKEPFKRKQQTGKDQKPVHEVKYRLLFHLNLWQHTYWTWSMPLVVITASNQEASSLASIMWQCHSTDVFDFPTNIPEKLHWDVFADMLLLKMKKLTLKHTLTKENLDHLKYRLLGKKPEDEYVTLNKVCQETMEFSCTARKKGFSFWKWFMGAYNLIEKHLLSYWENGLIMGFVKKTDAMEKLDNERFPPGTFIMRFSETEIENKDGIKEVYGRLTSVVKLSGKTDTSTSVECCNKTTGSIKRKVFENNTVNQFDFLNVADCQKLTKDTLARIVKKTRSEHDHHKPAYMYAYPSNGTVKTLFWRLDPEADDKKKICQKTGYTNPDCLESVNLGNAFGKMDINGSPSDDDHISDGKRPRLDIKERDDTFGIHASTQTTTMDDLEPNPDSSIVTPSFNANGIASPALDCDYESMTHMSLALPEDAQTHLLGLEKYLSTKQMELLTGWVSNNNSDTRWPINDKEIEDGMNEIDNATLDDILDILGQH